MDTLPDEILVQILLHVPPSEFNHFCRVDRRFASICYDSTFRRQYTQHWNLQLRQEYANNPNEGLYQASLLGNSELISYFLSRGATNITNALVGAAAGNHQALVEDLLKSGQFGNQAYLQRHPQEAPLYSQYSHWNFSDLFYVLYGAALGNSRSLLLHYCRILQTQATLPEQERGISTTIQGAIVGNHLDLLRDLFDHSLCLQTPPPNIAYVESAIRYGNSEIIQYILSKTPDLGSILDSFYLNACKYAIENGKFLNVQMFLHDLLSRGEMFDVSQLTQLLILASMYIQSNISPDLNALILQLSFLGADPTSALQNTILDQDPDAYTALINLPNVDTDILLETAISVDPDNPMRLLVIQDLLNRGVSPELGYEVALQINDPQAIAYYQAVLP